MIKKLKNQTVVSVYKPVELPIENYEELAQDLDVVNLAKQQARKGQPDSQAKVPDSNELHFKAAIKNKAMQAVHSVEVSISALKDNIQGLSVSKARAAVIEAPATFRQQIAAELEPRLRSLENTKSDYSEAVDDVNTFKRLNGIRRGADYPDSGWMTAGVLSIALIIESILNGQFFAAGSDTGLVGGVFQAFIIAAINIGSGFLLGWWVLPYKNHRKKSLMMLSLATVIIFLFIAMAFNLLVAHFREALAVEPDNAHQVAIEAFSNGILSISDFNSWVLFLIGMLFFILAIYKGYNNDDPYPGYGKVARRKESLEEYINDLGKELITDLDEMYDESIDQVDENYSYITRTEKNLNSLSSAFDQQNRILRSYISHLEDALNFIISLYRDTNASERESAPPEYFGEPYNYSLECEELNIAYRDKRKEIETIREEISSMIPSIRAQMLESKERYHGKVNGVSRL